MKNSIIYIDFDRGTLADAQGGRLTYMPSLQMGAEPIWEIHFQCFEQGTLPDMSDAVSWRAAIDEDFLSGTTPMVRSLDLDSSEAASGIIKVPIDTNTETFIAKVDGRPSVVAYFEIYGLDSNAKVIYDYRFGVNCQGTVDYQGGEPIPVVSGGVTLSDVYALLRAGYEVQFSEDGESWHDSQTTEDRYYRTRYPEGQWSDSILIGRGEDGTTPQLSIGTVTTTESVASAAIVGPTSALLLNLGIPRGPIGEPGQTGPSGLTPAFTSVTATTLLPDAQATASITGEGSSLALSFGIPRGVAGSDGTNGVGFNLVGEYSSSRTYNPVTADGTYEVVLYDGSSYAYIAAEATVGHTPPTAEFSDSYWQTIARHGDATGTITVNAGDVIGLGTFIDTEVSQNYYNKQYIDGQLSTKLTIPAGGSNGQVLAKAQDGYTWTSNVPTASKLFSAASIGNAPFDGSASISLEQIGAAAKEHTHEISGVIGLEDQLTALSSMANGIKVLPSKPAASADTVDKVIFSLDDDHIYRGVATTSTSLSADFKTRQQSGIYIADGEYTLESGEGSTRTWSRTNTLEQIWTIMYVTNFVQDSSKSGWAARYRYADEQEWRDDDAFFAEATSDSNPYDSNLTWYWYSGLMKESITGTGVHDMSSYSWIQIV